MGNQPAGRPPGQLIVYTCENRRPQAPTEQSPRASMYLYSFFFSFSCPRTIQGMLFRTSIHGYAEKSLLRPAPSFTVPMLTLDATTIYPPRHGCAVTPFSTRPEEHSFTRTYAN